MAYNIDTDRLIDVVEKEVVHPILKYKCAKAFQVGYKKGLQCAQKPRFLVKEGNIILIPLGMRWIPVEEQEQPTKYGTYLCHGYWLSSRRKKTETAEFFGEWKLANNFILTHWMPLPSTEGLV